MLGLKKKKWKCAPTWIWTTAEFIVTSDWNKTCTLTCIKAFHVEKDKDNTTLLYSLSLNELCYFGTNYTLKLVLPLKPLDIWLKRFFFNVQYKVSFWMVQIHSVTQNSNTVKAASCVLLIAIDWHIYDSLGLLHWHLYLYTIQSSSLNRSCVRLWSCGFFICKIKSLEV